MLRAFGRMCALDKLAISALLYSVLPLELATEMRSCKTGEIYLCTMRFHTFSKLQVDFSCFIGKNPCMASLLDINKPISSLYINTGDLLIVSLLSECIAAVYLVKF